MNLAMTALPGLLLILLLTIAQLCDKASPVGVMALYLPFWPLQNRRCTRGAAATHKYSAVPLRRLFRMLPKFIRLEPARSAAFAPMSRSTIATPVPPSELLR
jgi:hypothetical protein